MVTIEKDLCIGCGKCVKDCVAHNIILKDGKAEPKRDCFLCGHCVAVCPKAAVSVPEYNMAEVEEYEKESFTMNPDTLLHAIKYRRSIRDYQDRKIEPEKIDALFQAGRYTATAKNNQSSHFILVQQELSTLKELVWNHIDALTDVPATELPKEYIPFASFNRHRKADPTDDFLFRNAPAVLYITSDWDLDAGLAAQNIEHMAIAQGLGALYNGYLQRISDENKALKTWLGIENERIKACMLLGYPNMTYARTVPRREARVTIR